RTASWTATSSGAGTTSTRGSAPTTASRSGPCSCWTTGSAASRRFSPRIDVLEWALPPPHERRRQPHITGIARSLRLRVGNLLVDPARIEGAARAVAWLHDDRELQRQARDGRRLRNGPESLL